MVVVGCKRSSRLFAVKELQQWLPLIWAEGRVIINCCGRGRGPRRGEKLSRPHRIQSKIGCLALQGYALASPVRLWNLSPTQRAFGGAGGFQRRDVVLLRAQTGLRRTKPGRSSRLWL